MRCVHHRSDLCVAGVPPRRSGRRDRKAAPLRGAVSRTRASRRRLFSRQGAAGYRASAQGRIHRADLSARRDGEDHALLREPRHRARRITRSAGRDQAKSRRHHHHLSAVGTERFVDATLSRSARRIRFGLDAGTRSRPAAGRLAAAGDFGPCRLGWTDGDDRRNGRGRNLGHPRPGGRAGALVRHCGASKRRPLDIVGYGDEDEAGDSAAGEAEA